MTAALLTLLEGRTFMWVLVVLYILRSSGYALQGRWGPACYWAASIIFTLIAEFIMPRWP